MSFITKRDRVFNEYCEPTDLPARNECKLKAYSSCTDARAWSHFLSDKTEHLVEIIKRNNEVCRKKVIPTNVIIDMLMALKNAEIARLRNKLRQFEKMLALYDKLELSCDQRCEISNAQAMIKAADKSFDDDDMILDLNMSGYTEGMDSEDFQTGKSRGDEASGESAKLDKTMRSARGMDSKSGRKGEKSFQKTAEKTNQADVEKKDASTTIRDRRIDDFQEAMISKDAKLCAMQNTIAIMENDVCEPYCFYAHIYTALEKIYATLRQHDKYKLFLDTMSANKDTQNINIKGKILFKLKILEKFSIALLAPCSDHLKSDETCECYTAQVLHVETTFALTKSESQKPFEEYKRNQLVADIMENEEMKEILSKEDQVTEKATEQPEEIFGVDNYAVDTINLSRLKNLQLNYDELMVCYENTKRERDELILKCQKCDELEDELEYMRNQLREYNTLYSERDYYRKRSEDLDSLKEQYLILTDETSSLETRLKAEIEINQIKSNSIDDLRNENIAIERKLSEALIAFEKEKNTLQCKLKEMECKVMCQDQQVRSLSSQIDRILEQDQEPQNEPKSAIMLDQIEALNDQIQNLKDALFCSEEEKQQLQEQFEDKLKAISALRIEIEDWKSLYEKTLQRNDHLETYSEGIRDEVQRLEEEKRMLSHEVEEKSAALGNLINVINNKSLEINKLIDDMELKRKENKELYDQLRNFKDVHGNNVKELELARQESQELLEKFKDYDDLLNKKNDLAKTLEEQAMDYNDLRDKLVSTIEAKERLQNDLSSRESNNSILLQEVQRLQEINKNAAENMSSLENEKYQYKTSYELTKKESEALENKLKDFDVLREELQNLRSAHERLNMEKNKLEDELQGKAMDLDNAMSTFELTKKESEKLLEKLRHSENLKEDIINLSNDYQEVENERQSLQRELTEKNKDLDNLINALNKLKRENEKLIQKSNLVNDLEREVEDLKRAYNDLAHEKSTLQNDFDNKTEEFNNLYNTMEAKIEENRELLNQLKSIKHHHAEAKKDIDKLQDVSESNQRALDTVRRESNELMNKLKDYDRITMEFDDLKQSHLQMKTEKEQLQAELEKKLRDLKRVEQENQQLNEQAHNVMMANEDLEKALITARNEIINSALEDLNVSVLKEVEKTKNEKLASQKQIRSLLDKLDEAENFISELSADILDRDNKIAILQNHINSLEDEVKRLHISLEEVVNTGEEIKDHTYQKINQHLNQMEAHHSKAAHNMKMELARLQNEKYQLEEELSLTRIKSDESFKEKNKYISQIIHLRDEREIIITDIKQLELSCVGDSSLSPVKCNTEDVLKSLDRVRKYINVKNSKSSNLEQTLLKVQTSSQLLLCKADEAKKLVEKEKQKIINEKEEAISDKLTMEMQLADLKKQLEQQTKQDKQIIKTLEAELLNQGLIINKINTSTQDYVTKLKEELQSLQNLYENSLTKINDLQEQLQNKSDENEKKTHLLNRIDKELTTKSKEVVELQKSLDALKNKLTGDVAIQVTKLQASSSKNAIVQTDKNVTVDAINTDDLSEDLNIMKQNKNSRAGLKNSAMPTVNEVQILTANIENSFDFVKSSYVNYKLKQLSQGGLENHSYINGASVASSDEESVLMDGRDSPDKSGKSLETGTGKKPNLLNIYKRESIQGTFSKAIEEECNESAKNIRKIPANSENSNAFYEPNLTKDISNNGLTPGTSQDKSLFLIYRDSESSHTDKLFNDKDHYGQNATVAEVLTMPPTIKVTIKRPDKSEFKKRESDKKTDSLKLKQIMQKSPETTSSTGSTEDYFLMQKTNNDYDDSSNPDQSIRQDRKERNNVPKKKHSLHLKDSTMRSESEKSQNLSRVEADVLLLKENKADKRGTTTNEDTKSFGLKYILDTVNQELDPESFMTNKKLRKSRSEDIIDSLTKDPNSLKNTRHLNMLSNEFKTISDSSSSKLVQPKSVAEQSVGADLENSDYLDDQIRCLTKKLEKTERDYKKKIDVIKVQYDSNIKSILNEHNQGVKSIQSLHEETLQDIIKMHENEVENLRAMSIEAMRKADRLEKENLFLRNRIQNCPCADLNEEPVKISPSEIKKRKSRCRGDMKMLTTTNVEAFNVKPKLRIPGPCTCSLDVNVSDTIRTIFEQVDVEQRKLAEHAYLKYIANKILSESVESLDAQELSFLHLKVCRTWKSKLTKEEALQKRIDSLENELMSKQRHAQQHIAELDRKVAEERRRLQMAREAVVRRKSPDSSNHAELRATSALHRAESEFDSTTPPEDMACNSMMMEGEVNERRSAGDLHTTVGLSTTALKLRRLKPKPESRAVLAKLDVEERREKKLFDEPPTRLRRAHDRVPSRFQKK